MAVRKINESTLTAIGNSIRSKTGGSALINPEDMASEIESILTGGGSVEDLNILTGMTFTAGYLNSNAYINSQSGNGALEYTTDYIDVSQHTGDTLFFHPFVPVERGEPWIGYVYYDANKSRVTGRTTDNSDTYDIVIPSDVHYLRISFRTWDANTVVIASWDKTELIRRLKAIGFVSPSGV